jgi:hypothetical protein
MTETTPETTTPEQRPHEPRDAAYWAHQGAHLKVGELPTGAVNLNVEGRSVVGPLQGFGPMWQKTFRMKLTGLDIPPTEVIQTWKENFPRFWPKGNRFYAPLTGIAPGEVALISSAMPGGMKVSTGVMVLYADEESFTLMTAQGHPFSGWITFSAFEEEGGTAVQVQLLMRANDPIYEAGMRLGGHGVENRFWHSTLQALAQHFGVKADVESRMVRVDPKIQWSRASNVWYNAGVRSTFYMMGGPVRVLKRRLKPRSR